MEPLDVKIGSEYLVYYKGEHQKAIVTQFNVEKQEYYVHYLCFDRRLDEWVSSDRITPIIIAPVEPGQEDRKVTRNMKRKLNGPEKQEEDMLEREREEITKVKNIHNVMIGKYLIGTWYYSPFPDEYRHMDKMFVCQFCLKYMRYEGSYKKHLTNCEHQHPPGICIYKKGINKIYQIDGKIDKLFCQNLSLLSKLFLDHKTIYYDISPFLFYVMTELESDGKECIAGYFSKEKKSYEQHNLACILVLPPFQKKGYGRLLIEFSYELSKLENTLGSPEKPLSDLGVLGYRSFWRAVILDILKHAGGVGISIKDLCTMTSIKQDDVVSTLTFMGMLQYRKGETLIAVNMSMIEKYIEDHGIVTSRRVDPICINWVSPSTE